MVENSNRFDVGAKVHFREQRAYPGWGNYSSIPNRSDHRLSHAVGSLLFSLLPWLLGRLLREQPRTAGSVIRGVFLSRGGCCIPASRFSHTSKRRGKSAILAPRRNIHRRQTDGQVYSVLLAVLCFGLQAAAFCVTHLHQSPGCFDTLPHMLLPALQDY